MGFVTPRPPQRLSDLLDLAFQRYRAHFVMLLGIAALPLVPLALLRLALFAFPQAASIFGLLSDLVAANLVAGVLVEAAMRIERQQPITPLTAYRLPFQRYLFLLGALLLQALVIGAPLGLVGGCVVLAVLPTASTTQTALFMAVVVLVLGAPGLYLLARTLFIPQAVIVEGCNPDAALKRSWKLSRDRPWRIVGVVLLTTVLSLLIGDLPARGVQWALEAIEPLSTANLLRNQAIILGVGQLGTLLVIPLQTLVYTLLYLDIRVRREGFDFDERLGHMQYCHER